MLARLSSWTAVALLLAGCATTDPAAPPASDTPSDAPPAVASPADAPAPLTITPERPQAGQSVAVSYHPSADSAQIRTADTLELVYRTEAPDYRIIPMQKRGARWTARFAPDSSAQFLRFYVQSDSAKDQRGGAVGWGRMIYGADGAPVRGAHVARADFLREHRAGDPRRAAMMEAAYRKEVTRFPDHLVARAHLTGLEAAHDSTADLEALRDAMVERLDDARRRHAGEPQKLREVQRAYYALVRRDRAQSVGATLVEEAPRGPEAIFADFRRATAEGTSPEEAGRRAEAFVERFPQSFFESSVYESLFRRYRGAGQVENMLWAGRRWIETEKINRGRAHAQVARALSGAGRYEEALTHARRAVAVAPEAPRNYAFFKTEEGWDWAPAPLTPAERRAQARRQRGAQRAVLGRVHYRKRDFTTAAEVLARAVREHPADPDAWTRLAKAYDKTDRPERAYAAVEEALRLRPQQGAARRLFRRLYVQRHGSEEGLRDAVAGLARGTLLRQRIDRPAPAFDLTPLGRPASSDDAPGGGSESASESGSLRPAARTGKVLVLDFWASWCGPCHQAFPHLQAVYETYRDAEDVAFLVVNTSWNDTKARARQYIEEAGYTFPLYWDDGGRVADAFGVRSIPTTVLIGKGGRVQYRESGFGGPQRYEESLSMRIDLLRSLDGDRRAENDASRSGR